MLNFMSEIWNIIKEFWVSLTALIFWKIIKDTLPSDMSVQTLYKVSKKVVWRLSLVALLGLILFAIKLKVPSEQQKLAFLVTAVIIGWVLHIEKKKEEKTVKEIEE